MMSEEFVASPAEIRFLRSKAQTSLEGQEDLYMRAASAIELRQSGLTYREVGKRLGGVSVERARQIHNRGIRVLRYHRRMTADPDAENLSKLELSVRAENALRNYNINSISEAREWSRMGEWKKVPNMGRKTFRELQDKLNGYKFDAAYARDPSPIEHVGPSVLEAIAEASPASIRSITSPHWYKFSKRTKQSPGNPYGIEEGDVLLVEGGEHLVGYCVAAAEPDCSRFSAYFPISRTVGARLEKDWRPIPADRILAPLPRGTTPRRASKIVEDIEAEYFKRMREAANKIKTDLLDQARQYGEVK